MPPNGPNQGRPPPCPFKGDLTNSNVAPALSQCHASHQWYRGEQALKCPCSPLEVTRGEGCRGMSEKGEGI